ncbi:MAG: class I SAM-dependent methyltransferase [Anaerolineae bacterium]
MDHRDHVRLIARGVPLGGVWADLGAGEGAFTLALRDVAGPDVVIYAVDKDRGRLDRQRRAFDAMFPGTVVHMLNADFGKPLSLPLLDGVIMANSLHFFRDKLPVLRRVREYLKDDGRLILVEYDVDDGNVWVPYPLSFETFRRLAPSAGFSTPTLLATQPSRFLRQMYAAVAMREM